MSKNEIMAPAYHGKHSYDKYEELRAILRQFLTQGKIVNIDFLFENEINHYTCEIFCPVFIKHATNSILIESFERKRVAQVRKIMKKFMIEHNSMKKRKKRYTIEIYP